MHKDLPNYLFIIIDIDDFVTIILAEYPDN